MFTLNKNFCGTTFPVLSNVVESDYYVETKRDCAHKSKIDYRFRNVNTVIVKVTYRCNLDCLYCCERIESGSDMTLETYKLLVDRVLTNMTNKRITFILHGGEPTLVGERWLREAVDYTIKSAELNNKLTSFSMQSNAMALDESKVKLLSKLGIRLGISLDGPEDIPESMRKHADLAIQKFKMAQANGMRPGVLMTINHSNYKYYTNICHWLETQVGVNNFKANVVASVGRGYNLQDMQPDQIFTAYQDILKYMIDTEGRGVIENNLVLELTRLFSTEKERDHFSVLCHKKKCDAGERVICITPDGKMLPCGRFQSDDTAYVLGELNDRDIEPSESLTGKIRKLHAFSSPNQLDCDSCDAKDICSYGCPAFTIRSQNKTHLDCIPTKMRYYHYMKNLDRLGPLMKSIFERQKEAHDLNFWNNDYPDDSYGDYSPGR